MLAHAIFFYIFAILKNEFMKRLILFFFSALISFSFVIAQNGISSVGSGMFQKHTGLPANAFYSQDGSTNGYDPGDLNAVTIEAENLPLTSIIINSLNSNGSYIQYGGALSGQILLSYLVYLNHANGTNWRSSNLGFVTFSNEILGVYTGGSQTLHFTGSGYSSSFYPSTATNKRGPEF